MYLIGPLGLLTMLFLHCFFRKETCLSLKPFYAAFRLICCLPHWCWYLYNCASATCRRGKTKHEQHLANWLLTVTLAVLDPQRQIADSWTLFNWQRCLSVKETKWRGCWELALWNGKGWSRSTVAMRRAAEISFTVMEYKMYQFLGAPWLLWILCFLYKIKEYLFSLCKQVGIAVRNDFGYLGILGTLKNILHHSKWQQ